MLATLLVTLREGIEAFLIVAITLAYLRKTHRIALGSAVLWGIDNAYWHVMTEPYGRKASMANG